MSYIPKVLLTKLIRIFLLFLGCVPRKWTIHLAGLIGRIWFLADERHRKVALDNLNHAFGNEKSDLQIKELAQQVFQNIALLPFEIGWSFRLNGDDILRYCKVQGLSHLNAARKKGKGVLFFSAHIGNWEFLSVAFALAGHPVNGIYRPLDFKPADTVVYDYRTRFGAQLIPKKHSIPKALRCLRKNECVGMMLDQDAGFAAGVFADFFGRPACTNKALALLALKTEAPVIPAFVTRNGLNFYMEFGKEIPLVKTGERDKDIVANTQQYNAIIEAFVRRYPEQWFWVHRRWKNQPAQQSSPA